MKRDPAHIRALRVSRCLRRVLAVVIADSERAVEIIQGSGILSVSDSSLPWVVAK